MNTINFSKKKIFLKPCSMAPLTLGA